MIPNLSKQVLLFNDYILPPNCIIPKDQQDQFVLSYFDTKPADPPVTTKITANNPENPDPANEESTSTDKAKSDDDDDDTTKNAFSLLTRCIQNNQYLKALKKNTAADDDDEDEEFMSYYYKYYEHFYNLKKTNTNNRNHDVGYKYGFRNKKDKENTNNTNDVLHSPILVHNTSNTSLFPFFIFLRAKWRRYWRKPKIDGGD